MLEPSIERSEMPVERSSGTSAASLRASTHEAEAR
jgi:hypothetical protein